MLRCSRWRLNDDDLQKKELQANEGTKRGNSEYRAEAPEETRLWLFKKPMAYHWTQFNKLPPDGRYENFDAYRKDKPCIEVQPYIKHVDAPREKRQKVLRLLQRDAWGPHTKPKIPPTVLCLCTGVPFNLTEEHFRASSLQSARKVPLFQLHGSFEGAS